MTNFYLLVKERYSGKPPIAGAKSNIIKLRPESMSAIGLKTEEPFYRPTSFEPRALGNSSRAIRLPGNVGEATIMHAKALFRVPGVENLVIGQKDEPTIVGEPVISLTEPVTPIEPVVELAPTSETDKALVDEPVVLPSEGLVQAIKEEETNSVKPMVDTVPDEGVLFELESNQIGEPSQAGEQFDENIEKQISAAVEAEIENVRAFVPRGGGVVRDYKFNTPAGVGFDAHGNLIGSDELGSEPITEARVVGGETPMTETTLNLNNNPDLSQLRELRDRLQRLRATQEAARARELTARERVSEATEARNAAKASFDATLREAIASEEEAIKNVETSIEESEKSAAELEVRASSLFDEADEYEAQARKLAA